MKRIRLISLLMAGLLLLQMPASGQSDQIKAGDKIRITYTGGLTSRITGNMQAITDDSLRFVANDSTMVLPLSSIKRLDVSVGKKTNGGRGAAIGAVTGGLAFGLVAMASDGSCSSDDGWCMDLFSPGESFVLGFIPGAAGGALIGLVIGGSTKTDKWKEVPLKAALRPLSIGQIKDVQKYGITLRWSF